MQCRNHCEVLSSARHHHESPSPLSEEGRLGLTPGPVWVQGDTHTQKKKNLKELSRHKKADSFQITAKLQRRKGGCPLLQCIFDYHCQRDGLRDWEGFIAHFTPTENNAAKTKHSFFTLCGGEEESAENKTKGTQNPYRRPWLDMRYCISAGQRNQKPAALQLLL